MPTRGFPGDEDRPRSIGGPGSMLCNLLNRQVGVVCRGLLVFLDRSFSSVMGCFFVCLRFKDDDDHRDRSRRSHVFAPDKKSDVAASHNRLSSLFAAEEREDSSVEIRGNWVSGSPSICKEIKDETNHMLGSPSLYVDWQKARFLKACGTIPETPVEIRKSGEKLRRSPPNETHSDTPKFHSWMPNTSVRKLQTDKQPASPYMVVELSKGAEITSESPEHTPISRITDIDKSASINFTDDVSSQDLNLVSEVIDEENFSTRIPFTPWPAGRSTQGESKSVHFDRDVNACSHNKSLLEDAMKELTGKDSAMKILPPPTPLKLSDEMQTPGTVFPANMENVQKGKASIRSQYVYSVPNPVIDASQGNAVKEEKDLHYQLPGVQSKINLVSSASAATFLTSLSNGVFTDEEAKFEATLSSWLKPQTDNGRNFQPAFRRTYGDRPILGLVATHWNEEEQSHITPKWRDGNGIPNSTTKYKEDQKVSWHATPFEERLEKALSEESSLGIRSRVSGSPMGNTLDEDGDSAISRLCSSPHEKTLVSC